MGSLHEARLQLAQPWLIQTAKKPILGGKSGSLSLTTYDNRKASECKDATVRRQLSLRWQACSLVLAFLPALGGVPTQRSGMRKS